MDAVAHRYRAVAAIAAAVFAIFLGLLTAGAASAAASAGSVRLAGGLALAHQGSTVALGADLQPGTAFAYDGAQQVESNSGVERATPLSFIGPEDSAGLASAAGGHVDERSRFLVAPSGAPGTYAPDRPLPRTKHGGPIPDVDALHTQLGTRTDGTGSYNQGRQWEVDPATGRLQPTRDFDFTDHGYPATHPNPHQHPLTPNNLSTVPAGGVQRGQPEPFGWGWLK